MQSHCAMLIYYKTAECITSHDEIEETMTWHDTIHHCNCTVLCTIKQHIRASHMQEKKIYREHLQGASKRNQHTTACGMK